MRNLTTPVLVFLLTAAVGIAQPPKVAPAAPAKLRISITRLPHASSVEGMRCCVAFSPDGRTLAVGTSGSPRIYLWEVASAKKRAEFTGPAAGTSRVAFSSDGKMLAASGWAGDPQILVWDLPSRKQLRGFEGHKGGTCCLALSPDGRFLASACGNLIRFWDIPAGRAAQDLKRYTAVDSLAFSPDGKLLAIAEGDYQVRLFDAETGRLVHELPAGQYPITGSQTIAFSPDGKTLATGGKDGTLRFWDVSNGKELKRFPTAGNLIAHVAFSPNGRRLAVTHADGLRLWDIETGRELLFLPHSNLMGGLAYSPDGKHVAWGTLDAAMLVRFEPSK